MSTFSVAVQVGHLTEERFEFIEALVDTGASHSIFPARLLRDLGVEPVERWPFRLADEHQREFNVGTARLRYGDRTVYTRVVFGEDQMQPILGAISLEELTLAVDPVNRTLVPVPGLMMGLLGTNPSPA